MKNLLFIIFLFIAGITSAQSPDSTLIDNDSTMYKTNPADDGVSSDDEIISIEKKEDGKEKIVTIKIDRALFKKRFKEKKAEIKKIFKVYKEEIKKTKREIKAEESKNIIIEIDDPNEELEQIEIKINND